MSDRIKKIKVKKADGSMTDYIPIGADAENIDTNNGTNVQENIDDLQSNKNEFLEVKDKIYTNRIFPIDLELNTFLTNYSEEYIKQALSRRIKHILDVHYDAVDLIFHVQGLNIYGENIQAMKTLRNTVLENNIRCDTIKFYCDDIRTIGTTTYLTSIYNILKQFSGIEKVWVFNENMKFINDYLQDCANVVNDLKSNGYKVGCSYYWQAKYKARGSYYDNNVFVNSLDMVGQNTYIQIADFQSEPVPYCRFKQIIDHYIENIIPPENKEFYFSEYGIKPYWEYLINPAAYNYDTTYKCTYSQEVVKLYMKALLESNIKNKVKAVQVWFAEEWDEETCKFINNYLKGDYYDND